MPRLYLSSLFVASNRDTVKCKLEVTHMVNASSAPDTFPGEFEYLDMDLQDESRQAITPVLQRFLDFVKAAICDQKGCVLIYSDRGVSRSGE